MNSAYKKDSRKEFNSFKSITLPTIFILCLNIYIMTHNLALKHENNKNANKELILKNAKIVSLNDPDTLLDLTSGEVTIKYYSTFETDKKTYVVETSYAYSNLEIGSIVTLKTDLESVGRVKYIKILLVSSGVQLLCS